MIESLSRSLDPGQRDRVQGRLDGLGREIEVVRSRPYGGSCFLDRLWRRLELDQVLGQLLPPRARLRHDLERILFGLMPTGLRPALVLRPLYHRLPERIEAHVLLCWLALLPVRR